MTAIAPWYGADASLRYGIPPAASMAAILETMGKLKYAASGGDPNAWPSLTLASRKEWIAMAAGELYEAAQAQGPTDPPPAT